jgi:hypothetical protein
MEYYSAIKKNKIRLSAGKWMELEIIMLRKISQTLEDENHVLYVEYRFFFKDMKVEGGLFGERDDQWEKGRR